jgi:peroxiredoxin
MFCAPLLAMLAVALPVRADDANSLGRAIEDFSLPDIHGKTRRLADFADVRLVVVAFLGTECPLARLYAPRVQQLANEYAARGVSFVAIDANSQDSLTEMAAFARKNELRTPFLHDAQQRVADQFGAERNPLVFVLDRERVVRYQGRIDDQYGLGASSGYARPQVKRRDLASALDELLAGKQVSQPITLVTGCRIGRKPRAPAKGAITFNKNMAPLLQNRCVSCHRPGEIGPFALTDYDEVVGWAEMIREVVDQERMPPWSASAKFGHFSNDARLSAAEKQVIRDWIENGCPQGDPKHLPPPRTFADGWQIDKPDQVIRLPKPFKVPAEGTVPYQYFYIDPGWKEDRWIRAAEVRPGNRGVVHHILASIVPPTALFNPRADNAITHITSYVPGSIPHLYSPGVAIFVPARSRIVINVHYTPNGSEQEDQTALGVVFADPATVRKKANWDIAENRRFKIVPQARDQEFTATYEFRSDQLLLSMSPHMHLRGQSFRYEAHYADGSREILLDVPRYDFNWQLRYDLVEPKRMPAGARLVCYGRFDNSEENVANPDPSAQVTFGWETYEEMMTGFFTSVGVEDDVDPTAAKKSR